MTSPPDLGQLMSVRDVARYVRLDERTVRRWIADGALPHVRLGDGPSAHIRVDYRDLRAFLGFRDDVDRNAPVLDSVPNSGGAVAQTISSYAGPSADSGVTHASALGPTVLPTGSVPVERRQPEQVPDDRKATVHVAPEGLAKSAYPSPRAGR